MNSSTSRMTCACERGIDSTDVDCGGACAHMLYCSAAALVRMDTRGRAIHNQVHMIFLTRHFILGNHVERFMIVVHGKVFNFAKERWPRPVPAIHVPVSVNIGIQSVRCLQLSFVTIIAQMKRWVNVK
jgi:hypothetical protein